MNTNYEIENSKRYTAWSDSFPPSTVFVHQNPFGAMKAVNRWTGEVLGGYYKGVSLTPAEILLLNNRNTK